MGKFDAGTAVDAMEWDFTAYGGGTGIIPEPSTEIIDEFNVRVQEASSKFKEATDKDLTEPMSDQDVENLSQKGMIEDTINLLAFVCQDNPNAHQLGLLPPRVLLAFQGWLVGELNPESVTATTKR